MPRPKVCVVGSSNLDLNALVPRFPEPGETLHGSCFSTGYGGKGANQAVMAARMGADVCFIGRVGDDVIGRDMLDNFQREGIETRFIRVTPGVASGVAIITVNDAGQNNIVVIPGANGRLTAADVEGSRAAIVDSNVLVLQMEVPLEANLAAMRIAAQARVPVIFNPAPAPPGLPDEAYRSSHIFCVNETEAAILGGDSLQARGAKHVVVTRGSRGCLVDGESIPAPTVTAIDTTGAGDAFVGSLAFDTASGRELKSAAERACRVAAYTVQRHGTQTSFPRTGEI